VLAAHGGKAWLGGHGLSARWALLLAGLTVMGGAGLVGIEAAGLGSTDTRNLLNAYGHFLTLSLASLALLTWRPRFAGRWLQVTTLALLILVDLFLVNGKNNLASQPPSLPPPTVAAVSALPQSPEPYRVRAGDQRVFAPNEAILPGVQNPAGDSPMVSRWVLTLLASEYEWRIWQLFNVRYILTRAELGAGTELLRKDQDLNTYRMASPLPRAWVVRDLRVISDDTQALEAVLARPFHPGQTVVLDRPANLAPTGPQLPSDQRVRILEYSPQRLELDAMTTDDGLLVLSEAYHPGWRATLDGQYAPIYRANLAFRAVDLPAGTHRLVMTYEPLSLLVGLSITLASLAGFAALLLVAWRRAE